MVVSDELHNQPLKISIAIVLYILLLEFLHFTKFLSILFLQTSAILSKTLHKNCAIENFFHTQKGN